MNDVQSKDFEAGFETGRKMQLGDALLLLSLGAFLGCAWRWVVQGLTHLLSSVLR